MNNLSENNLQFTGLLDQAIANGASDLHITANSAPQLRIDGLLRMLDVPAFSAQQADALIAEVLGNQLYKEIIETRIEQDFSFSYKNMRLRANVYFQKGSLSISVRLLSNTIRDMKELGLPPVVDKFLTHNQGLLIVAGPTGHGKSTTLAAMIDKLSRERWGHIITIEDPIEYVFDHKKSIISQREVGSDTTSFAEGLRSSLRQDPDIVMVGEIRDKETVEAALQLAETGHLVLTTLHTMSAAQTASRIIDIFPEHQQEQVRVQLAEVLVGVVSQRLLKKIHGGRTLVCEVLVNNTAVKSMIRDNKTHQLPNMIATSASEGMISLDRTLADLVERGEVALDEAMAWSLDPKSFKNQIY